MKLPVKIVLKSIDRQFRLVPIKSSNTHIYTQQRARPQHVICMITRSKHIQHQYAPPRKICRVRRPQIQPAALPGHRSQRRCLGRRLVPCHGSSVLPLPLLLLWRGSRRQLLVLLILGRSPAKYVMEKRAHVSGWMVDMTVDL